MSASPFSFVPAAIATALHLSGCVAPMSPEAQCFAAATVDYRAAWREAEAVRADLDRGYALHHEELRLPRAVSCRVGAAWGSCIEERREVLALPVGIDLAVHSARLSDLEAEMDALRPAAMTRAAPCGYGGRAPAGVPAFY